MGDFGAGFNEIKETPNLSAKVDQTIKKAEKVVKEIRKISAELRIANENIKENSLSVADLKENTDAYNIENMKVEKLDETFAAVFNEGARVGEIVATVTGYEPKVFEIPPSRATTTTTTTTTATTTTTTAALSTTSGAVDTKTGESAL